MIKKIKKMEITRWDIAAAGIIAAVVILKSIS